MHIILINSIQFKHSLNSFFLSFSDLPLLNLIIFTMETKKRKFGDYYNNEDLLLLPPPPLWEEDDDLIQKILVWLPVKSLLRFKSVCKSWRKLIESSFFIHLHTTTTANNNNSSSNKFGSFTLLASVDKRSSECALLRLSSSQSESESESVYISGSESGSGAWWWSTTGSNHHHHHDDITYNRADCDEEEDDQPDYDDQVFKVDDQVFKLECLGFPHCYKFYTDFCLIEIVGSCNGLVCLYNRYGRNKAVSLWNPAIRQFRILPNWLPSVGHGHGRGRGDRNLVAFGFDVETKDYKVVLFTCLDPKWYRQVAPVECLCRVQVYSLSTDSWRLLEGITCLPGYPFFDAIEGQVLYLNGSCFFMARFLHTKQQPCIPENDRFIISFDFTKEIITPMQLPDHHRDQKLYLSCLGDKIALFQAACYSNDNDIWITYEDHEFNSGFCSEFFNIWVLNEHSSSNNVNKKSWTILYSFRRDCKIPGQWNIPRGISNDGEFALLETRYSSGVGKKMKLYNLTTKQVKKNFLSCSAVTSQANAYKPSLVSIIGGNCAAATTADKVIGDAM